MGEHPPPTATRKRNARATDVLATAQPGLEYSSATASTNTFIAPAVLKRRTRLCVACSATNRRYLGVSSFGKLHLGKVHTDGKAWRISYPGLVPHGGYFDAPHGLMVAYAHGPKHFVMRYADASVEGHETLGDNPWIGFSTDQPVLSDRVRPAETASVSR